MNVIPVSGPKITSAIWGPYEEYIISGHEDGRICHYDVKVNEPPRGKTNNVVSERV